MERLEEAMRERMAGVRTRDPRLRAVRRLRATGRAYVDFALAEPGLFAVAFATPFEAKGEGGPYGLLNQVLDDLTTFYFDTALSASPASLSALLAFARPDHILYGSDFPFAPDFVVAYFNRFLDTYPALEATGVHRANAVALFSRFS